MINTPITERVTLHLLTALSSNLCGLIAGSSLVGKTETIRSLFLTLAQNFRMWPCNGGLNYECVSRILKGNILSKTFICFDNINQI